MAQATGIDCDRCGRAVNFASKAGLSSPQRSQYCQPRPQSKTIHVSEKPKTTVEGHSVCTSPKMFDSTFQLVRFIRSCNNGEGLSKQDTQALLDLLFDPRFDLKKVTVRSAKDVARYLEMLHP